VQVHINDRGYKITWPAKAQGQPGGLNREKDGAYPNDKLLSLLQPMFLKKAFSSVVVSGDDGVDYGLIVQAIDTAKSAGVPSVALSTE
jgi:biopolymer transport protein ExbD